MKRPALETVCLAAAVFAAAVAVFEACFNRWPTQWEQLIWIAFAVVMAYYFRGAIRTGKDARAMLAEAGPASRIRLRIRLETAAGDQPVIIEETSDQLARVARYSGGDGGDRWFEVFPGDGFITEAGVIVEIQAAP
jgi:hypothetical protein